MKNTQRYKTPTLEVVDIRKEDIITTSGDADGAGSTPIIPVNNNVG